MQDENKIIKEELRGRINAAGSMRCINRQKSGLVFAAAIIFIAVTLALLCIIILPPSDAIRGLKLGLGIFIPAEIFSTVFFVTSLLLFIYDKSYSVNLADGRKILITYRNFKMVYTINGVSWIVKNGQAVQVARTKTVTVYTALSAFLKRKDVSKKIDGDKTVFETYREPADVFSGATQSGPLDNITFIFTDS